jgi:hypothetical protein
MALALRDLAPRRRPSTPPTLVVVQGRRRRITRMSVIVVGVIVVGLAVLGVLHTQIAERQWQIDQLERSISTAHEDFDTLRALRAELRSPERLNTAARALGMRPATASNFIPSTRRSSRPPLPKQQCRLNAVPNQNSWPPSTSSDS